MGVRANFVLSEVRRISGKSSDDLTSQEIRLLADLIQNEILFKTECNEVAFPIQLQTGVQEYNLADYITNYIGTSMKYLEQFENYLYVTYDYNGGSPTVTKVIQKFPSGTNVTVAFDGNGDLIFTNSAGWDVHIDFSEKSLTHLPIVYVNSTTYKAKFSSLPSYQKGFIKAKKVNTT